MASMALGVKTFHHHQKFQGHASKSIDVMRPTLNRYGGKPTEKIKQWGITNGLYEEPKPLKNNTFQERNKC